MKMKTRKRRMYRRFGFMPEVSGWPLILWSYSRQYLQGKHL